jgi:endonuclease/exonuclease/phosphatase (EEP) superfamily protein YafD
MSMPQIKMISLNIEFNRHFDTVLLFFQHQHADIILVQEIFEIDIPLFENILGMKSVFTPMKILCDHESQKLLGTAIFTNLIMTTSYSAYYYGDPANIAIAPFEKPESTARAISVVELKLLNQSFCFINTHFTWTPDGRPSSEQERDLQAMLSLLSTIPEFILCGDFNAPRGTLIFDTLAEMYQDNIPADVSTTIDKDYHRAGDLQLVVDGLFSTAGYQVHAVEIVSGLSDHCAIVATLSLR